MCGKMAAGKSTYARQLDHDQNALLLAEDDLCKLQLGQRSEARQAGSAWTTGADFELITAHFQAPGDDERFNVVRRERS
jgi:predicted kinase